MILPIHADDDGFLLDIKVVPGSSRTRISGLLGESIKINVAAAPEKGKANKELVKYLSKTMGVPKSAVVVVSGEKDHRKQIRISGIGKDQLESIITELI